jgi:L,D-transpeptidase ErfK/SrfK
MLLRMVSGSRARAVPGRGGEGSRTSLLLAALLVLGAGAEHNGVPDPFASLPPVLGAGLKVLVEPEDTLLDVAYRHRLGFEAVARLNPGIDPWIPDPGTVVELPTRYVLPNVDPSGLVINVPEMRLYDFTVGPPEVFAIAIGDAYDPTLLGEFRVGAKRTNPTWYVPKSILEERPGQPPVVPPGPDNPLGSRWMTIGDTSYGIHGTNVRWSIGRQATHGCIRLYEDEIERLYDRIPTGTRLQLLYQPYKWGREGAILYLEAHPDPYERAADRLAVALEQPRALGLVQHVDVGLVRRVVDEARGVPVAVGQLPDPEATGAGVISRRPS